MTLSAVETNHAAGDIMYTKYLQSLAALAIVAGCVYLCYLVLIAASSVLK